MQKYREKKIMWRRMTHKISMMMIVRLAFTLVVIGSLSPTLDAATFYGESTAVGNGTARTWVVLDDEGKPTSVGVTMSETALSGLSSDPMPVEYRLALPKEASATPFDNVTLDWNAMGHEPPGVYDAPHFDVHFYMINYEERLKITDEKKFEIAPPAEYLPADYQKAPGGVPQMGAHWVDVTSPEFQGKPFTITFIYGSYDGTVHFWEPMVSLAFLQTKPDFNAEIKQPQAYPQRGYYYPLKYSVRYDTASQEYRIALDELTLR
jgi:hypothetical protein